MAELEAGTPAHQFAGDIPMRTQLLAVGMAALAHLCEQHVSPARERPVPRASCSPFWSASLSGRSSH